MKPLLQALSGKIISPKPIWLMRQAGRYLPEYKQIRAQAGDFLTLCYTPKFATEVTLQPIRRYGFDAAILFSDILVVPHALGQKVWFAEGEGPKLERLSAQNLSALKTSNIAKSLLPVYETVSQVKAALPKNTTLIGFAGAPWTVASYMIAGGSSDECEDLRKFAYADPTSMARLIEILTEATSLHLIEQIKAGAEAIQIFESWAGSLPTHWIKPYSVQPIANIVAMVHKHHPEIPIIVFPRGAGSNYKLYAETTKANALSIDYQTRLSTFEKKTVVQGNLDPLALVQGGKALETAVTAILEDTHDRPHIFNLGHGIRQETPPENVSKLIELIRSGS